MIRIHCTYCLRDRASQCSISRLKLRRSDRDVPCLHQQWQRRSSSTKPPTWLYLCFRRKLPKKWPWFGLVKFTLPVEKQNTNQHLRLFCVMPNWSNIDQVGSQLEGPYAEIHVTPSARIVINYSTDYMNAVEILQSSVGNLNLSGSRERIGAKLWETIQT